MAVFNHFFDFPFPPLFIVSVGFVIVLTFTSSLILKYRSLLVTTPPLPQAQGMCLHVEEK